MGGLITEKGDGFTKARYAGKNAATENTTAW
jgi:hypothetical protein